MGSSMYSPKARTPAAMPIDLSSRLRIGYNLLLELATLSWPSGFRLSGLKEARIKWI